MDRKISRLRKNIGLTKTASYYMFLHSLILRSGDVINFQAKIMANRLWYQIEQDSQFDSSSYYDGPDFERAFEMYLELALAFKGVAIAEQIKKQKNSFLLKSEKLIEERNINSYDDMYQSLKRQPLFLGINDF